MNIKYLVLRLVRNFMPEDAQLHFVDLRDHYFMYPFEMHVFSEDVWKNFLNSTSNFNRFCLPDYRGVFEKWFKKVDINILDRQEANSLPPAPGSVRNFLPTMPQLIQ